MKNKFHFILTVLIISGCCQPGIKVVSSPDRKFRITCSENESIWNQPGIVEWTNVYQFKSEGRWQCDSSQSLSFNYYDEDISLEEHGEESHLQEWVEYETGIKPKRIDQITLSDGTPIYFVYALTHCDTAYHDYYYSYTALCVKDGKILKYPIFSNVINLAIPGSDIIIINSASIDFDFTIHPHYYEYWVDHKILDEDEDARISLDPKTGELSLAGGELRFSFSNDTFSSIIY